MPQYGAISIHAPRTGRDGDGVGVVVVDDDISIHAPRTGRDAAARVRRHALVISIHAPRTGRDLRLAEGRDQRTEISIHAPRTGRDDSGHRPADAVRGISIHAPRTGRDLLSIGAWLGTDEFQSTRPVRGATSANIKIKCKGDYFNPRAPYGARPWRM